MKKFSKRFLPIFFATTIYTFADIGLSVPFFTGIEHEHIFDSQESKILKDDSISGFGLVYDSNVRDNRLYNWRTSVELNNIDLDNGNSFKTLFITNTLGISLFRNKRVRLFVGPRISIGLEDREEDKSGGTFLYGGAVGLNVHVTDSISLGLDFDYAVGSSNIIHEDCEECEYTEDLSGSSARFYLLFSFGSDENQYRTNQI